MQAGLTELLIPSFHPAFGETNLGFINVAVVGKYLPYVTPGRNATISTGTGS